MGKYKTTDCMAHLVSAFCLSGPIIGLKPGPMGRFDSFYCLRYVRLLLEQLGIIDTLSDLSVDNSGLR